MMNLRLKMSHEVGGIEGWFVRAWARLGVGTVLMHRTVFKMQPYRRYTRHLLYSHLEGGAKTATSIWNRKIASKGTCSAPVATVLYLATLPEDCSTPVWPATRNKNKQPKSREARNKETIIDRQYFSTPTNEMTRKLQCKTSRI